MKASLLSLTVLASAVASVAAQSSTACAADYIVEACLGTENAKLASCGDNDWDCKCAAYQAIVTCFNNCPNDPRKDQDIGQQEIMCGYASQFPSSTPKAVSNTVSPTGVPSSPATTTTDSSSNPTDSSSSSGSSKTSSTSSAAGAAKTNSAADLALNAGGVLAAVAGVVVAVL